MYPKLQDVLRCLSYNPWFKELVPAPVLVIVHATRTEVILQSGGARFLQRHGRRKHDQVRRGYPRMVRLNVAQQDFGGVKFTVYIPLLSSLRGKPEYLFACFAFIMKTV